jgi:hypothetical protein
MPRPRIHPKKRKKVWRDRTVVADTMWARRLWALRNATGWSRDMIGEKLGCGRRRVNGIIAGRTPPVRVILALKREEREHAEAIAEGRCLWTGRGSDFRFVDAFGGGRPKDIEDALGGSVADGRAA